MRLNVLNTGFGTGVLLAVNFWLIVLVSLIALPTPVRDQVRSACQRWMHPASVPTAVDQSVVADAEGLQAMDHASDPAPLDTPLAAEPGGSPAGETSTAVPGPIAIPVEAYNPAARREALPTPRRTRTRPETLSPAPMPDDAPTRRQKRGGSSSPQLPGHAPETPRRKGSTMSFILTSA